MNKITIDMSEWNNTNTCELTFIKPNGTTIHFPKVFIDGSFSVTPHKEYARTKEGYMVMSYPTDLIDEINGEFRFIPLIDDDGVQYREIKEVKA